MADSNLHKLSALGQSVWIDFLSRNMLHEGKLARMMEEDAVVGVTSNPTIFQKAISDGNAYDEQLKELLDSGESDPTVIFSLQRYKEVVEAYIRGLERLVAAGGDPKNVHSVASFFVSRVDTETDKRLDAIGGHDALKGKLGIANAKLAYQHYLEAFSGPRWEFLEGKGATKQRCLWASTSTKNPDYRDVMYVEGLLGPDTVNTMPEETIRAFQDHGRVEETLTKDVDAARKLFDDLREAGIDYDDVVLTLEEEGVQKFADSFDELIEGIPSKRGELVRA